MLNAFCPKMIDDADIFKQAVKDVKPLKIKSLKAEVQSKKPKPKPITKKKPAPKSTVQTTRRMDKSELELKLTAVKDMLVKGLISKSEASVKRKQILDQF